MWYRLITKGNLEGCWWRGGGGGGSSEEVGWDGDGDDAPGCWRPVLALEMFSVFLKKLPKWISLPNTLLDSAATWKREWFYPDETLGISLALHSNAYVMVLVPKWPDGPWGCSDIINHWLLTCIKSCELYNVLKMVFLIHLAFIWVCLVISFIQTFFCVF